MGEPPKPYPYTQPRMPVAATWANPGPIYKLPNLTGEIGHDTRSTQPKAPAYSFGLKTELESKEKSPGPAAYSPTPKYTHHGPAEDPKYSIGHYLPNEQKKEGPAPCDYDPRLGTNYTLPRAPTHVMGHYLTELTSNTTPAPNAYKLPSPDTAGHIPSSPKYSIGQYLPNEQKSEGPSPATYNVEPGNNYMKTAPHYSIATGAQMPPMANSIPSPAHYKHELVTSHKPSSPAFSFGIIHSPYKGEAFKDPPVDDD